VENLSKKYGDNIAVNGISFSLTKGEVFAFLGPNGAGKTTTVEILECLRNPTGGQAKVLGYDVSKRSDQAEIRKRIGRINGMNSSRSYQAVSNRESALRFLW
jgi:ABC-2 type transport system ATP-binding protein